ncbi:MAG TPA: redox-sensitive transcriptional activator SoxR [Hellea balneolensis]|uniref:Redox-sensitive transcriptional activator SoxR n=1 Tax=Hellea balneolensis TaxID=287478 RepID=A0A7C5R7E0_9PROT|nr:redox-sensitive transcriptional activator SoxR [Hellea balneolensis]
MKPVKNIRIGRVAARTGVSVSAIRFYEDKGLISSHRNSSGHRMFLPSDIRKISLIVIAQNLGFSLAAIKTRLDRLPQDKALTKADWQLMSEEFRKDIDRRISNLEALRGKLTSCIGCGCLSMEVCSLYNIDDEAGKKGSGPRYLLGDKP